MTTSLFQPIQLGDITLKNRIVMPPMTRSRASQPGDVANDLMATYYAQRATAGLIISEGTQISAMGKGYAWTPGIYTAEQIQGWRKVTDAVHAKGGTMFAQLWHVGRVTHPDNIGGEQPISSSALKAQNVKVFIDNNTDAPGFVDAAQPREMTIDDIQQVVAQFKQAAINAIEAGFDGIELHAANGYLINQFIDSESNQRTDQYGGSLQNRLRFLDEVVGAMVDAIGANRVGVRLAPLTTLNGTVDADPINTYTAAAALLNKHHIVYLHIAEVDWDDAPDTPVSFKQGLRDAFDGVLIYAGRYNGDKAHHAIDSGLADMIGFGRPFVANPDLPERIKQGYPLAKHVPETLFGGGEVGLTDYPTYKVQDHLLFQPFSGSSLNTNNRIVMAPMTRSRSSQPGDVPNQIMADYYQQRASAGLIISEGTPISAVGRGYSMTPGIYTTAQVEGWKQITQAVHAKDGKIFAQLWHVGRRSHSSISGQQPVAASAIKIPDQVFGPLPEGGFGMIETEQPKAMTQEDINNTINDFVQTAKNAIEAGFDGVEIHAAHGYLFDTFLHLESNQRQDQYGGSQQNRMRFLLETLTAVADAIGGNKVAVRLSPHVIEGFTEEDPEIVELTLAALANMVKLDLAYVHFSENISRYLEVPESFRQQVREVYPNPIMIAGKLTKETAQDLLAKQYADLVAFATPYVTNPDLVERFYHNWPLAEFDADARLTLYGGDAKGYSDYPQYKA
ncbi:hypothetical protein GCM10009410_05080 [Shewanella ulleungensis]|uniref:NADH:flavin oxidoreductase/NADH oxidase N-terminal domain-containing protein n=1 Tax=Shewanella ulleungensis TaxID=2282699 RepID=A0ABQ2QEN0_9GAMM|nr:hypothetical protein GCM10009410_05080 [Shewanella ulleungensis]